MKFRCIGTLNSGCVDTRHLLAVLYIELRGTAKLTLKRHRIVHSKLLIYIGKLTVSLKNFYESLAQTTY